MKKVKLNTEIKGYDLTIKGFIMSGEVHNLKLSFLNVNKNELPESDEMELIEDEAKEMLLDSHYSPELSFD